MAKQPGLGVMIRMLAGNKNSVDAFKGALNKKIASVALEDEELRMRFTDGTGVAFFDNGQSCCESRYMRTDDDLPYFVGATLMDAEMRDSPDEEDEHGECHEVQFLIVTTSKGSFTMASHNEHNGYYGGFSLEVKEIS